MPSRSRIDMMKLQVRLDGQSTYPTLWPSFVELGQSQSAQFPCIKPCNYIQKNMEKFYISSDGTHTHTLPQQGLFWKRHVEIIEISLAGRWALSRVRRARCGQDLQSARQGLELLERQCPGQVVRDDCRSMFRCSWGEESFLKLSGQGCCGGWSGRRWRWWCW